MLKRTIKRLIAPLRNAKRRWEIKKSKAAVSREKLVADLHALGIAPGDVVMVHSSLKSLGYVEGGVQTALEALYEAITPEGTLIIPTYHMVDYSMLKTCLAADKYVFDPRTCGTELGTIPSAFLRFPGIHRSIHPTHSISAVGKQAKYVTEAHHLAPSTFGPDSPWDRLVKLNGKVLGIGISMAWVTFYHMIEDFFPDEFPLPVKMKTTYRLKCKDWNGNLIDVPVTPLDPEVAKRRIEVPDREYLRAFFRQEFERIGLLKSGKVGEATAWYIPARGFYDHLVELMREGITIYSLPEELSRRAAP